MLVYWSRLSQQCILGLMVVAVGFRSDRWCRRVVRQRCVLSDPVSTRLLPVGNEYWRTLLCVLLQLYLKLNHRRFAVP